MGGTIEARYGVEYFNQKNELYLKIYLLSHAVGEVCGGKHIQGSLGTEPTLLDLKAIFMGKQIQGWIEMFVRSYILFSYCFT